MAASISALDGKSSSIPNLMNSFTHRIAVARIFSPNMCGKRQAIVGHTHARAISGRMKQKAYTVGASCAYQNEHSVA